MTYAATFALGVLAGLLVGLWLIARSVGTPETASVPRDPRTEELAVLAATGRAAVELTLRPACPRSYDSAVLSDQHP